MCKYCNDKNGKPTGIWAYLTPYEEAQKLENKTLLLQFLKSKYDK